MSCHNLTTSAISIAFANSVQEHSGRVTETFDDGTQLFCRSLLPMIEEVRPKDRMQGGVALRANEFEICLYPFLFREVCRNGAVMANALQSWHVEYSEWAAEDDVLWALGEAVSTCCREEVFRGCVSDVRESLHEVDMLLCLMPIIRDLEDSFSRGIVVEILARFSSDQDQSRFSLMNAVTSVARDTRNPEQRWRLEEFGGGIAAAVLPAQPLDSESARRPVDDMVRVG